LTHSQTFIENILRNTLFQQTFSFLISPSDKHIVSQPYVRICNKKDSNRHWRHSRRQKQPSLSAFWRNFSSCPTHIHEQCYKTLVRPQLEYASTVSNATSPKSNRFSGTYSTSLQL